MNMVFYLHASGAVIAMALAMITSHTVHALLYAVLSLLCLALSMYSLSLELAAALEVIVYAGAIMVLFVFAMMFLNLPISPKRQPLLKRRLFLAIAVFCLFVFDVVFVLRQGIDHSPSLAKITAHDMAIALLSEYGLFVEIISFILLAGLVTAVFVGQNFLIHKKAVKVARHDPS